MKANTINSNTHKNIVLLANIKLDISYYIKSRILYFKQIDRYNLLISITVELYKYTCF